MASPCIAKLYVGERSYQAVEETVALATPSKESGGVTKVANKVFRDSSQGDSFLEAMESLKCEEKLLLFEKIAMTPAVLPYEIHNRLKIAYEVARDIKALHDQGLCHGNIKPKYITIFGEGSGISEAGLIKASTLRHHGEYAHGVAFSDDVWSFGLVLFELFHGSQQNAFRFIKPVGVTIDRVEGEKALHKVLVQLDPKNEIDNLIAKLLKPVKERMSIQEAVLILYKLL